MHAPRNAGQARGATAHGSLRQRAATGGGWHADARLKTGGNHSLPATDDDNTLSELESLSESDHSPPPAPTSPPHLAGFGEPAAGLEE